MTLQNLGPMLEELRALLYAKGCKVTEVSITLYPGEDGGWRHPRESQWSLRIRTPVLSAFRSAPVAP